MAVNKLWLDLLCLLGVGLRFENPVYSTAYRVTGQPKIVLHTDLGRILNLSRTATEHCGAAGCRHGAGHTLDLLASIATIVMNHHSCGS